MKITLEAEVLDEVKGSMRTASMYLPGHCTVRLKVLIYEQEFRQDVILRLDEVQSVFDLLMRNLTRNMREALLRYFEEKSSLDRIPLMPILTFERMRG